jgi:hypothetical protein
MSQTGVYSVFFCRQALKKIGVPCINIHLDLSTLIILVFACGVKEKMVFVGVPPQRSEGEHGEVVAVRGKACKGCLGSYDLRAL